ncbi:MAG: 1-acyl-sn-glycerol-3-phosphate acyltransferase [Chitinophagaceae bacterium]|nr:1-acyl-sn-glycerol-3-phosphate acyltransferase [Oligoflexus sp.]
MLKYVLAGYFWILFILTTCVLFTWISIVYAYHRLFKPNRTSEACHNVAVAWGRTLFALGPAWTHEVRGRENLPPVDGEPYVMVANHSSTADIWALFLVGGQFRWLSKDAMFRIPLVGQAMRWSGYVSVTRGNKQSQYLAIETSRAWLRKGVSMAFFPEGTRSEDGHVKDFKIGAFRLAQEENVMIIPIVLRGTRDMLVKASGFPKKAHLDIEILPPVRAMQDEDSRSFADRIQKLIANRLAQPAGTTETYSLHSREAIY